MTEQAEDLTLWLVMESRGYQGDHGRWEWTYEDADDSAARGYFFSRGDAGEWIAEKKQQLIVEGRAKNEAELERLNADALVRYEVKVAQESARRVEYDVLVAAGVEPSFERPKVRAPFEPRASKFNEAVYLSGQDVRWEAVEMKPYKRKEET
jgi:hypothetical protein